MTAAVQQLVSSFDALSEEEKQEAVAELLRRISRLELEPLSEEALLAIADELFVELDDCETAREGT